MLDSNVRARTIAKKSKISLFSFTYSTQSERYLKIQHTTKFKSFFTHVFLNLLLEPLKNTVTEETKLTSSEIRFTK